MWGASNRNTGQQTELPIPGQFFGNTDTEVRRAVDHGRTCACVLLDLMTAKSNDNCLGQVLIRKMTTIRRHRKGKQAKFSPLQTSLNGIVLKEHLAFIKHSRYFQQDQSFAVVIGLGSNLTETGLLGRQNSWNSEPKETWSLS